MKKRIIFLSAMILSFSQIIGEESPEKVHAPSKTSNDRHSGPPPRNAGPLLGEFLSISVELQLSREQVEALTTLHQSIQKEMEPLQVKLQNEYNTLHQMLNAENVDLDEVREQLDKISPLRNELMIYRIKYRLEVDKILTSEQKNIYVNFIGKPLP